MIRKIAIFFTVALALPLSSQAMVGGPFDGGDYGLSLDDQGVYQAILRMKNGSGLAQWGANVSLEFNPNSSGSSSGTAGTATTKGGVLNRSLIYLQGVTYYGIASGAVDHDRGTITGVTNGQSDLSATSGAGASASSIVVVANNDRGFSANSQFTGKITSKAPILKFTGKGQVTVITQTAAALTAANAAVTTAQTAANAALLAGAPSPDANGDGTTSPAEAAAYQNWYNSVYLPGILSNLQTFNAARNQAGTGDSFTVPMTVTGQRKFFVSQR